MTISDNSQLGIRFIYENGTKLLAVNCMTKALDERKEKVEKNITFIEETIEKVSSGEIEEGTIDTNNFLLPHNDDESWNSENVDFGTIDRMFCFGDVGIKELKWFLIQESVYRAAELIKIGDNFDCWILRRIKQGDYIYMMGKNRMVKFIVVEEGIKGIWWDNKEDRIFEWAVNYKKNKYFYYGGFDKEFSQIMQLLTFIELGDIEVTVLNSLQKIKAEKKENDIYNGSKNTVYVVDSSWNKMIIRTEGFAVRGHFRLQPCGEGMRDRKLLWINAFEKNGYIRRPKAEIIKK